MLSFRFFVQSSLSVLTSLSCASYYIFVSPPAQSATARTTSVHLDSLPSVSFPSPCCNQGDLRASRGSKQFLALHSHHFSPAPGCLDSMQGLTMDGRGTKGVHRVLQIFLREIERKGHGGTDMHVLTGGYETLIFWSVRVLTRRCNCSRNLGS